MFSRDTDILTRPQETKVIHPVLRYYNLVYSLLNLNRWSSHNFVLFDNDSLLYLKGICLVD